MPTEMISSAEHLTGEGKNGRFDATTQAWHDESWRLYGEVGEYKSAVNWIANGLSQLVIRPTVWDPKLLSYVNDDRPEVWKIIGKLGNQAELFRNWGTNSVVVGEAELVEVADRWRLRSRSSILVQNNQFYLDEYGAGKSSGANRTPSPPLIKDFWRIFQPHARYALLSDTPPSAFLSDLEQMRLLRSVLNSKLKTRLWMNGIWVFGQKVSMPTANGRNTPGRQASFLTQLRTLVTQNMKEQADARDISPIFMQVATAEVGKVVEQYYPEVAIDAREADLRKEIRQTLRELLDLPVEMQTSMGDTNHWGSWSITEMNLIYCLLPRAKQLLDALSFSWYQEQLVAAKISPADAALCRLVPDASNLQGEASPENVRQAAALGAVGLTFLRGQSRIPEDAAPDKDEAVRMFGWAKGLPYLALWGTEAWKVIEAADAWDKAGVKQGAPGTNAEDVKRGPGVGDPGAPDDVNSEVTPKK